MIVDELIAVLGFDLRGESDLRRFEQGMDRAEQGARGFAATLTRVAAVAAGALAGLEIGRQVAGFVGSITTVNAQFEAYEATLKTITGSAEEASRAMDWITEFGRTTPYEASQVTQAFVRLKAYGIDPMDGSLRTVGDAASAMGKSLMEGVEAIADAVTGENERLKEFGVRASVEGDQITYSWTEAGKVMTKTVRKDAVEIQAALMGIFGRFRGAMDEQAKTWNGMTSNLADTWTEFLREIGEAGYYDDVKRRLQGVLDFANQAFESGMAGDLAQNISDALVGAMDVASHVATQAYRIGRAFYSAADGVAELTARVTGLSKGWAAAGLGAGLLASSAGGRALLMATARRVPAVAAALALDDIISGLNGDDSIIGSTEAGQQALDNLKTKFQEVTDAAAAFSETMAGIRERLQSAFGNVDLSPLEGVLDRAEGMVQRTLLSVQQLFTDPVALIRDISTTAVDNLAWAMGNFASALTALASPVETIKMAVEAIEKAIGSMAARADQAFGGIGLPSGERPQSGGGLIGSMAPKGAGAADPVRANADDGVDSDRSARPSRTRAALPSSSTAAGKASRVSQETIASRIGGAFEVVTQATLDISRYTDNANQVFAIQSDLSRGVSAAANLDISQWMANAARAKAELQSLQSMAAAARNTGAAVVSRPAVAASPATP